MKPDLNQAQSEVIQLAIRNGRAKTPKEYVATLLAREAEQLENQSYIESMIDAGSIGEALEITPDCFDGLRNQLKPRIDESAA